MTVILDTMLLVLFVVGTASRSYIEKHRRLQSYTGFDFTLLIRKISAADRIVVTPNTLSEASNLISYIKDPARQHIYECFRTIIQAPETEEQIIDSRLAAGRNEFTKLGLTDCVLLELALAKPHLLLTVDLSLYLSAARSGISAENFNHLRGL